MDNIIPGVPVLWQQLKGNACYIRSFGRGPNGKRIRIEDFNQLHSQFPEAKTVDWREEKVTLDTGYRGERMSAYLFLPKNVQPPCQTVLFYPSARVYFVPDNKNGLQLGDTSFFDYIVQSGRAVMYPIYENTYERQLKYYLLDGDQNIQVTADWYKDAARSLDYLGTRSDIDNSKIAYLGVSMGSAYGSIIATLMQNRLKAVVFIDGRYFFGSRPRGGDKLTSYRE